VWKSFFREINLPNVTVLSFRGVLAGNLSPLIEEGGRRRARLFQRRAASSSSLLEVAQVVASSDPELARLLKSLLDLKT